MNLRPEILDQGAAVIDGPLSGHPDVAASGEAGVTDDGPVAHSGEVNQPIDPIVAELAALHQARTVWPAGHTIGMTNPIVNGRMLTLGTCSCGVSFSYAWGEHQRMDAAIEAHWQKFDHLPDKVDGRGRPIESSDGRTDEAMARDVGAASGGPSPASADHDAKDHESVDEAGVGSERPSPSEADKYLAGIAARLKSPDAGQMTASVEPAPAVQGDVLAAGADEFEAAPIGAGDDDDDWLLKAAEALAWKDEDSERQIPRTIPTLESPLVIGDSQPEPGPWSRELIKAIAMDIGKEIAAYIEVMYPKAVAATSSSFLLSVQNSVFNEIMAAIEVNDQGQIEGRLAERKKFRREWKAAYRKIRAENSETDHQSDGDAPETSGEMTEAEASS
jgi:hypothetical protein